MTEQTDLNKLIDDINSLPKELLPRLQEEISLILAGIESTEPQSYRDLVPIDVPIGYLKNAETGALEISFPFVIGLRSTLGWRELEVTPAAQQALLQIFSQSLADDEKAGRIQPTPTKFQ